MSLCPICGIRLDNSQVPTRRIHDIIFHREYFENQVEGLTKDQLMDMLWMISKTIYFDEN